MSAIAHIVVAIKRAGVPIDGEQIFRQVEHHVEKQTMYSLLSYHARKTGMVLREKDPDQDNLYRYRMNPNYSIAGTLQDDIMRVELSMKEGATPRVPPAVPIDPPTVTAREKPTISVELDPPAPDPYRVVYFDLKANRDKMRAELEQIEAAMRALELLRPGVTQ